MTPVIVLQQGVPVLAAGGAGGLRIATGVTQALLATLAFDRTPLEAVSAPRFHTPYERYTVELEYGSEPGLASELRARGERVDVTSNFSAVQVIRIRERHGAYQLDAAADPRFAGSAVVR
jgi:gamma-glutamyltranspeptidase/glutathione hydrolase